MAVAAVVALGFDMLEESIGGSAVLLGPKRFGFERLFQRFVEWTELVDSGLPLVHRLLSYGCFDPLSDGVPGEPGRLSYLVQRELVAEVHPPNFSYHFHVDRLLFSRSESEQKQLNIWVNFQSAEQPLTLQFSVSGNTPLSAGKSNPLAQLRRVLITEPELGYASVAMQRLHVHLP